jgi:hypothetical protein
MEGLTAEMVSKMSPVELQNLAQYLKSIYKVPEKNDLNTRLIDNIDEYETICQKNWKTSIQDMANYITKDKSTLPVESMELAGKIIGNYLSLSIRFDGILENNVCILDPLAANGVASKIIYDQIKEKIPHVKYISSDIQNLSNMMSSKSLNVEFEIDCVDSIIKHQESANVLLLACPPPYSYKNSQTQNINANEEPTGFVDYFAIKKWTEIGKKYLIYIGEMGFSDGTSGMYYYMLNHPVWKLEYRKVIIEKEDLFGRLIKKEIFIFKNKNLC